MEDKKIEIIGIDHGWSNMKTVSSIFTSGVKEITTEPERTTKSKSILICWVTVDTVWC